MAAADEIERLVVRILGDANGYIATLDASDKATTHFVRDANGYLRNLQGQFVSAQTVMRAESSATIINLNKEGEAIQDLGAKISNMTQDAEGRWRRMDGTFASSMEIIRNEVGWTTEKLKAYGKMIADTATVTKRLGQSTASFGRKLSLSVTTPLTAAGVLGSKTFSDYEQSLSQIQGLVGLSKREVDGINDAIRETAPAVAKGPKELADAMFFITSAGVQGKDALDALNSSAKAASAGLGETVTIADAVTSAMNAYGPAVVTAGRATDILVAAVREGKIEAGELAPQLGRLLPTASALGIGLEDVAGVMAVMSRTGLNAAQSATSVSSIMSTMLKPSKEARTALEGVGLSMGKLREMAAGPGGLVAVMRTLDNAFADNQEGLAMVVPNVEALRGVMNVLAQDASLVDEVMEGVKNSVGATDAAFEAGANTASRKWNQAMANMQLALVDLGETLTPVVEQVTHWITVSSQWFSELDSETKTIVVVIGAAAAAFGPLLVVIGSTVTGFSSLIIVMGTAVTTTKGVEIAMKAASLSMKGVGLAAAAAAAVLIYQLHPATQKMNDELKELTRTATGAQKALGKRFQGGLSSVDSLGPAEQLTALKRLRSEAEASFNAAQSEIGSLSKEIYDLKNPVYELGKELNYVLGPTLDAQGIALAEGHLEDARARAEMFKEQIEQVEAKMASVGDISAGSKLPDAFGIKEGRSEETDKAVKAFLDQMGQSVSTFGMEGPFKEITDLVHKLALEGEELTAEELTQAETLARQLTTLEKMKKVEEERKKAYEEMANKAAKIIEEQLTPIEKLKVEIQEIEQLARAGALTRAEAEAAIINKVQQHASTLKTEATVSAGAGLTAGSKEAMLAMRAGRDSDKSVEKGVWELVEDTKVQVITADQILAEMKLLNQNPVMVASIP